MGVGNEQDIARGMRGGGIAGAVDTGTLSQAVQLDVDTGFVEQRGHGVHQPVHAVVVGGIVHHHEFQARGGVARARQGADGGNRAVGLVAGRDQDADVRCHHQHPCRRRWRPFSIYGTATMRSR